MRSSSLPDRPTARPPSSMIACTIRLFTRPVSTISTTSMVVWSVTRLPRRKRESIPQPVEHVVDHRPAAMDDDRVHADLAHQDDVAREIGHRLGVAHGIAAEFDHDDGAGIALHVGQRLGQCACGGDPVPVHVLSSPRVRAFPRQSMAAMIARKVPIPSPFSDDVRTSSGKAAGCRASAVRVRSMFASRSDLRTLSALVRTHWNVTAA